MGAGIILIVVGVLVGGVMAAAPRGVWWATQSWKFRNPEANEPSDLSYGMTRAGGVLLICLALVMGSVVISDALSDKREREAEARQRAAEAAFVVPPPEKRGPLPVIGYVVTQFPKGLSITVYYVAPGDSVREAVRESASRRPIKSNYPCYTSAGQDPAKDAILLVNPELFWAPEELGDVAKSDGCRLGVGRRKVHETSRFIGSSVAPMVVTDSAIVDRKGTEIRPAATGNVVPKLSEKMYPDP